MSLVLDDVKSSQQMAQCAFGFITKLDKAAENYFRSVYYYCTNSRQSIEITAGDQKHGKHGTASV